MPTAKLLKPKTLRTAGQLFTRDVVEPISNEMAAHLAGGKFAENFEIKGFAADDFEADDTVKKPLAKGSLKKAILAAIDDVSVDDDENFGPTGIPTAAALSAVLGYDVTDDEVGYAVGTKKTVVVAPPSTPSVPLVAPTEKTGVKITRVNKTKSPVVGANAGDGLGSAAGAVVTSAAVDPTTANAVEV